MSSHPKLTSSISAWTIWAFHLLQASMFFLCRWSWHPPDRRDSVQYNRAGLLSVGERDCFTDVSSPVQSSQSVRLVLQQLPGLQWAAVHHHQDPSHAHRRLRLLGPEHIPEHPLQKNHQPDCLLWVWPLTSGPDITAIALLSVPECFLCLGTIRCRTIDGVFPLLPHQALFFFAVFLYS